MKYFFTSDTHYGHKNIIKYANRPYSSVSEMNEDMIKKWNSVVSSEDIVYHIGDFAFTPYKEAAEILRSLNGSKVLIFGNHDKALRKEKDLYIHWRSAGDLREITVPDPDAPRGAQGIVLCHYAMRVWNKSYHGSWQLYGHSHGSLPDDPNSLSLDVGVDCWNFTPVSYEQIKEKMKLKTFKPLDHHGANE